jgi:hypothetical protein
MATSKTQRSAEIIDLDMARTLATVVLGEKARAGDLPSMIEWLRRHGPEWRVAIERVKRFACVVQPYGRQRAF